MIGGRQKTPSAATEPTESTKEDGRSRKPYEKPGIVWIESLNLAAYQFVCQKTPAEQGPCEAAQGS